MLSLRTHNILDYVIGALLIVAPFLFGFSEISFARDSFVVLGMALIGYSLLTDYRYSMAKIIPLKVHMVFDVVSGLFIIAAPSIYDYRVELTSFQNAMHFVFGFGAIGLVALTHRSGRPVSTTAGGKPDYVPDERYDRAA